MPIIRDILIGAQKHRANLIEMCRALDINPSDLHNSDIDVPFEKAYKSWEVALEQTGDLFLGLHLGEQTNPSIMGLIGHLMQSCRTLADAFQSACNHSAIVTDMVRYSMETTGDMITLRYEPNATWEKISPVGVRQGIEQALAGTLNVFQLLSGKKIIPLKVTFTWRRPGDLLEYERVFQAPIKFEDHFNSLTFSKDQLAIPIITYDESLLSLFNQLIQKKAAQLKSKSTIDDQVKNEILTTFNGQVPSLEVMASRLNMTPRSLQRRLEEHHLTYRQLTHALGKEISTTLLKNKTAKVAEVANALGYTDARAFQRAFKSWTGLSPGEFRKTLN